MNPNEWNDYADDLFVKPRFWIHVWWAVTYPWRLVRHMLQMRALAKKAERWRELVVATTDVRAVNRQYIRELQSEITEADIVPESDGKKQYN